MSAFLFFFAFLSDGFAKEKPPVLVELFTSEYCPACPPADQYLAKLSKESNMITLGCHVTYFQKRSDLGRATCSQRQFDYVRQLKLKSPYTPQFIVNGHKAIVGTQQEKVAAALLQAQSADTEYIEIYPKAHGVYGYRLPSMASGSYGVSMALYNKDKKIGKRSYANAVDIVLDLADWNGLKDEKVFFPAVRDHHAGFAIFVKNKKTGQIIAAGDYRF